MSTQNTKKTADCMIVWMCRYLGMRLDNISDTDLAIVSNKDAIAVNQVPRQPPPQSRTERGVAAPAVLTRGGSCSLSPRLWLWLWLWLWRCRHGLVSQAICSTTARRLSCRSTSPRATTPDSHRSLWSVLDCPFDRPPPTHRPALEF